MRNAYSAGFLNKLYPARWFACSPCRIWVNLLSIRRCANCHLSTFLKRKGGLFKKAHELSVLCSVEVAVIIFGHNKKLYEYSSGDIKETIDRFHFVSTNTPLLVSRLTTVTSMVPHMNTKALETSMLGPWTTTTTMRSAHHP